MRSGSNPIILSKFKLLSMKHLIPKPLRLVFELIWKYVPYYGFYMDVTIVQFFTKTRVGYWFYCFTFIFALVQPDAPSNLLVFYIIGASVSLTIIKSSSKVSAFFEERLEKKTINNIIKDSPVWIMINTLKPLFFLCLLAMLIDYVEMHRISQINRLLLSDYMNKWEFSEERQTARKVVYDIVHMVTTPSGLKGGLVLLKSRLLQLDYLSFFLLSILMVIVALLWLKEKQKIKK